MENIELPCGQCIGCKLERSRQWAMRCMHEASLNTQNCFITLTYNEEHIPNDHSLKKPHFQKFIKRLRKRIEPIKIRYYMCGEYGDQTSRPHYHALIFNYDFPDKIYYTTKGDNDLYISPTLEKLWGKGISTIGNVTFASAAYIARYCTKKITGKNADQHYQSLDIHTGEIFTISPEYTTMSRRPGIGKQWYEQNKNDVFPFDECIVNGHPVQPPKYYDNQLPEHTLKHIKLIRKREAEKYKENNTPDRLAIREIVCQAKYKQLPRGL